MAGLALFLAPAGSRAADVRYNVYIAGRPLDRAGHSGLVHRGVTYVNVVRAVKAFNGLLAFTGRVVRVAIGKRSLVFTVGSRTALVDGQTPVTLSGAPFLLQGDIYAPAVAVARLAGAKLAVDTARRSVELEPGAGEQYPPPAPARTEAAESDEVLPSPAQALTFVPTATFDATGLHAKVDITNLTARPYSLSFPGGTQIAFVVERNGAEVWNSAASAPPSAAGTLRFDPHETKTETVDWPGFAKRAPGRYTLRVRLLTAPPLDSAPVSLGVATPAPSPASS